MVVDNFYPALYILGNLSDNGMEYTEMKNKTIFISILLLLSLCIGTTATLVIVTLNYTPKELGPAAITFWFLGVLVVVSSLFALLEFLWKLRKEDNRMEPRKVLQSSLRTGFLLGFTAAILLALSSLRSLSLRDVILFVLTVLLIELYFRTRKAR